MSIIIQNLTNIKNYKRMSESSLAGGYDDFDTIDISLSESSEQRITNQEIMTTPAAESNENLVKLQLKIDRAIEFMVSNRSLVDTTIISDSRLFFTQLIVNFEDTCWILTVNKENNRLTQSEIQKKVETFRMKTDSRINRLSKLQKDLIQSEYPKFKSIFDGEAEDNASEPEITPAIEVNEDLARLQVKMDTAIELGARYIKIKGKSAMGEGCDIGFCYKQHVFFSERSISGVSQSEQALSKINSDLITDTIKKWNSLPPDQQAFIMEQFPRYQAAIELERSRLEKLEISRPNEGGPVFDLRVHKDFLESASESRKLLDSGASEGLVAEVMRGYFDFYLNYFPTNQPDMIQRYEVINDIKSANSANNFVVGCVYFACDKGLDNVTIPQLSKYIANYDNNRPRSGKYSEKVKEDKFFQNVIGESYIRTYLSSEEKAALAAQENTQTLDKSNEPTPFAREILDTQFPELTEEQKIGIWEKYPNLIKKSGSNKGLARLLSTVQGDESIQPNVPNIPESVMAKPENNLEDAHVPTIETNEKLLQLQVKINRAIEFLRDNLSIVKNASDYVEIDFRLLFKQLIVDEKNTEILLRDYLAKETDREVHRNIKKVLNAKTKAFTIKLSEPEKDLIESEYPKFKSIFDGEVVAEDAQPKATDISETFAAKPERNPDVINLRDYAEDFEKIKANNYLGNDDALIISALDFYNNRMPNSLKLYPVLDRFQNSDAQVSLITHAAKTYFEHKKSYEVLEYDLKTFIENFETNRNPNNLSLQEKLYVDGLYKKYLGDSYFSISELEAIDTHTIINSFIEVNFGQYSEEQKQLAEIIADKYIDYIKSGNPKKNKLAVAKILDELKNLDAAPINTEILTDESIPDTLDVDPIVESVNPPTQIEPAQSTSEAQPLVLEPNLESVTYENTELEGNIEVTDSYVEVVCDECAQDLRRFGITRPEIYVCFALYPEEMTDWIIEISKEKSDENYEKLKNLVSDAKKTFASLPDIQRQLIEGYYLDTTTSTTFEIDLEGFSSTVEEIEEIDLEQKEVSIIEQQQPNIFEILTRVELIKDLELRITRAFDFMDQNMDLINQYCQLMNTTPQMFYLGLIYFYENFNNNDHIESLVKKSGTELRFVSNFFGTTDYSQKIIILQAFIDRFKVYENLEFVDSIPELNLTPVDEVIQVENPILETVSELPDTNPDSEKNDSLGIDSPDEQSDEQKLINEINDTPDDIWEDRLESFGEAEVDRTRRQIEDFIDNNSEFKLVQSIEITDLKLKLAVMILLIGNRLKEISEMDAEQQEREMIKELNKSSDFIRKNPKLINRFRQRYAEILGEDYFGSEITSQYITQVIVNEKFGDITNDEKITKPKKSKRKKLLDEEDSESDDLAAQERKITHSEYLQSIINHLVESGTKAEQKTYQDGANVFVTDGLAIILQPSGVLEFIFKPEFESKEIETLIELFRANQNTQSKEKKQSMEEFCFIEGVKYTNIKHKGDWLTRQQELITETYDYNGWNISPVREYPKNDLLKLREIFSFVDISALCNTVNSYETYSAVDFKSSQIYFDLDKVIVFKGQIDGNTESKLDIAKIIAGKINSESPEDLEFLANPLVVDYIQSSINLFDFVLELNNFAETDQAFSYQDPLIRAKINVYIGQFKAPNKYQSEREIYKEVSKKSLSNVQNVTLGLLNKEISN
jgi:hypothetical protein